MTLLKIKESTKDVDFMIPNNSEWNYLIKILGELNYRPARGIGLKREDESYVFSTVSTNSIEDSPCL